jgi:gluconate 5-dehydrogenase
VSSTGGAPFDLAGKTALVTGSGSGLGLAIARGLGTAGARVVLNGRNPAKLAAAAEALRRDGLAIEVAPFDVADPEAVRAGIAAIAAGVAPIDILVNTPASSTAHRSPSSATKTGAG